MNRRQNRDPNDDDDSVWEIAFVMSIVIVIACLVLG